MRKFDYPQFRLIDHADYADPVQERQRSAAENRRPARSQPAYHSVGIAHSLPSPRAWIIVYALGMDFLLQSSAGMAVTESPRQAALRRITEQQARIARQRTLIAALKANGSSTQSAMESLGHMQGTLSSLRDSLRLHPNEDGDGP